MSVIKCYSSLVASPLPTRFDAVRSAGASGGVRGSRHSDDDVPKMVFSRDPERSLLTVGEHRKRGESPFAGRQG